MQAMARAKEWDCFTLVLVYHLQFLVLDFPCWLLLLHMVLRGTVLLFQLHATDLPQALAKHKCINTVTIPATSVKHAVLFTVPKESLHLGEYFLLPSKKAPNPQKPSIRDTGKKYLFLVGFDFVFCFFFLWFFLFFLSLEWIYILWAAKQRILVLLSKSHSSGARLQFANRAVLNIFWHVSSLFSGWWSFLIPCIVQIFLQGAGMLKTSHLIFRNHQPLVILFSRFVNAYSFLLLSDLHPYFFISNNNVCPVSQCAASHFPKKKKDFSKWSLDGYTSAQDFTSLLFQTFKPFLTAL